MAGHQCVAGVCEPVGTGGGVGGGGSMGGGGGTGGGDAGMGGGGGTSCPGSCPAGYLCDGTSNGECTLRVTGLRFVAPDAGRTVGPATRLAVLVAADTSATVALPSMVSLEATNGAYA